MLMDGDHLGRIAYETIRQLGDMDKPVFLDSYIDETTEVGDVGHDTGQYSMISSKVGIPTLSVR